MKYLIIVLLFVACKQNKFTPPLMTRSDSLFQKAMFPDSIIIPGIDTSAEGHFAAFEFDYKKQDSFMLYLAKFANEYNQYADYFAKNYNNKNYDVVIKTLEQHERRIAYYRKQMKKYKNKSF